MIAPTIRYTTAAMPQLTEIARFGVTAEAEHPGERAGEEVRAFVQPIDHPVTGVGAHVREQDRQRDQQRDQDGAGDHEQREQNPACAHRPDRRRSRLARTRGLCRGPRRDRLIAGRDRLFMGRRGGGVNRGGPCPAADSCGSPPAPPPPVPLLPIRPALGLISIDYPPEGSLRGFGTSGPPAARPLTAYRLRGVG